MNQIIKKMSFALLLLMLMLFGINTDVLAKEVKLSTKSIAVESGKSKSVTIKNVKAKKIKSISVKTSNRKVATVKKSSKTKIIIYGGNAGSTKATITLKIKGSKKKVTTKKLYVKIKVNSTFKVTCGTNGSFSTQKDGIAYNMTSGKTYTLNNRTYVRLVFEANAGYKIGTYIENGKSVSKLLGSNRAVVTYCVSENQEIVVGFIKETNKVILNNGTIQGGSEFSKGETVTITANKPEDGYTFKEWKVVRGSVTLKDETAVTTTFTMPNEEVEITAVFESKRTTSQVTEKFKSYFYDESGNVNLNKLEGFTNIEWAAGSKNGTRPLEVFKDITGMDVSTTESYNYRFVAIDGQSTISITGKTNPDSNGIYAIMKVSIPSCSEIQIINIGSQRYFDGTNSEGIPVFFL